MPIFRAMAKKPRDLEAVVGRYRGPKEEVLVLNFHRRRTGAYDVSGKCNRCKRQFKSFFFWLIRFIF